MERYIILSVLFFLLAIAQIVQSVAKMHFCQTHNLGLQWFVLTGGLDKRLPIPRYSDLFWSWLGAFLGILAVSAMNQWISPKIDIGRLFWWSLVDKALWICNNLVILIYIFFCMTVFLCSSDRGKLWSICSVNIWYARFQVVAAS